jgi:hypothetical protein
MVILQYMLLFVPFLFNAQIRPIDVYQFESVVVEYGNIVIDNNSDGYVRFINYDGSLLDEFIFDNNGYDVFRYLAIVNEDEFVIVCDTYYSTDMFAMPEYRDSVLLKFDTSGVLVDRLYISKRARSFYNHNHNLILAYDKHQEIFDSSLNAKDNFEIPKEITGVFNYQYQGEAYINNNLFSEIEIKYPGNYKIEIIDGLYSFRFFITIHPDILVEANEYFSGYLGEVKYYSFGDLYLDNNKYLSGETITLVGNHHLLITGEGNYRKDLFFTILPDVVFNDGVIQKQLLAGQEFDSPIRIFSNAQTVFLNNEVYNSELIEKPGSYELELIGTNEFSINIDFYILPQIEGVNNNETYQEVEINIFGDAYINGEYISDYYYSNQSGKYKLELMLGEEIYETINFEIIDGENESFNIDYNQYLPYAFMIISLIGGVLILRKK